MLTTYHHPVPLSCNLEALTSWNPPGLSRPVMGLLYFTFYLSETVTFCSSGSLVTWQRSWWPRSRHSTTGGYKRFFFATLTPEVHPSSIQWTPGAHSRWDQRWPLIPTLRRTYSWRDGPERGLFFFKKYRTMRIRRKRKTLQQRGKKVKRRNDRIARHIRKWFAACS